MKVISTRRDWFRIAGLGLAGASTSGWFEDLAAVARAADAPAKRSLILLWLNGGPSTIDLFDLKPDHENGGPFREASTAVAGLRLSEHLPKMAERARHLALVRSVSGKEGDHGRASFVAHTGVPPQGAIRFPAFGAALGKELGDETTALPAAVCIAPRRNVDLDAHSAGFLGSRFAPLLIGENSTYNNSSGDPQAVLRVPHLSRGNDVSDEIFHRRTSLLRDTDRRFAAARSGVATDSHTAAVERAVRMIDPRIAQIFDLSQEKDGVRDGYGRTLFGQGCLMARRLVERGVSFVEVTLDGWDTHQNNFDQVRELSRTLDLGWSALVDDLSDRGLLESTVILAMGEFGRTPKINGNAGRDHFPAAWSVALTGGGIRGGTIVGRTADSGLAVVDRPVSVPDLLATVCTALDVDPYKQNISNVSRPIRIVDKAGQKIEELL